MATATQLTIDEYLLRDDKPACEHFPIGASFENGLPSDSPLLRIEVLSPTPAHSHLNAGGILISTAELIR